MTDPIYSNETAAREHLEGIRWADGVYCPHCGGYDDIRKLGGAAADKGFWHCKPCRKKFTVTVGTVFERSHIPLSKWLAAFHLMCSSMKRGGLSSVPPMGGKGEVVEADETYFGNLPEHKAPIRNNPDRPKFGPGHKRAIVSLVERGGEVRSFYAEKAHVEQVAKIVREHVDKESRLHTDESRVYWKVGEDFAAHEAVNHGKKEYARGDVTTNTVESYFSVFKRGMKGVYQHCDERHLHRYVAEFDFRHNHRAALGWNDEDRTLAAVR